MPPKKPAPTVRKGKPHHRSKKLEDEPKRDEDTIDDEVAPANPASTTQRGPNSAAGTAEKPVGKSSPKEKRKEKGSRQRRSRPAGKSTKGQTTEQPGEAKGPQRGKELSKTQLEAARSFLTEVSKLGNEGVCKEFQEEVKNFLPPQPKFDAFAANTTRNRYKDVACLDATRVVLTLNVPPETDYIHANYVQLEGYDTRKYIATQAPTEATTPDFWRMVYETEATSIVMLCAVVESGIEKCAQYFPAQEGAYVNHGPMFVNNRKVWTQDELTMHTIEVIPDGCSNSVLTKLIVMHQWPDRGVPGSTMKVLRLLRSIPNGTCVIHCSAGVGRTGTAIAVDFAMFTFRKRQEKPVIKDIVKNIRTQRACAVQTEAQYLYIVTVFVDYLSVKIKDKKTQALVHQFRETIPAPNPV
ncbi:unnamed protein product [Bursaphelenchus xylophilus]|uniref:(pine wood nematode) hypothetical protein n=1 Tax=Bursaphelenchus xylophilus TaxID=6326 RepID=A0A7I8XEL9_BURXY|nr:unnamed protein product [Bursaphelenchus xylophilus]CAG9080413.1 unnamed protein product [Bursaphelenchus xylophilus]